MNRFRSVQIFKRHYLILKIIQKEFMKVYDSEKLKNAPKFTLIFRRNSTYPQNGSLVLITEDMMQSYVESANIALQKSEQRLMSEWSKQGLPQGQCFHTNVYENDSGTKAAMMFRVKNIIVKDGRPTAILENYFINAPQNLDIEFPADDLSVIELWAAEDTYTESNDFPDFTTMLRTNDTSLQPDTVWYKTRNDKYREYKVIGPAPESFVEYACKFMIKEWSLMYDFNYTLSKSMGTYEDPATPPPLPDTEKPEPNTVTSSALNDKLKTIFENDMHKMHPLYGYTMETFAVVMQTILEESGLEFSKEKEDIILEKVLTNMVMNTLTVKRSKEQ